MEHKFTYPENTDLYSIDVANNNFLIVDNSLFDLNEQLNNVIGPEIEKMKKTLIGNNADELTDTLSELKAYIDENNVMIKEHLNNLTDKSSYIDFIAEYGYNSEYRQLVLNAQNNDIEYFHLTSIDDHERKLSSNIIGNLTSLTTSNKSSIITAMSEMQNDLGGFTSENTVEDKNLSILSNIDKCIDNYDASTLHNYKSSCIIPETYILLNTRKCPDLVTATVTNEDNTMCLNATVKTIKLNYMYDSTLKRKQYYASSITINEDVDDISSGTYTYIGYINYSPGSYSFYYSNTLNMYSIAKIEWGYTNGSPFSNVTYIENSSSNEDSHILYLDSFDYSITKECATLNEKEMHVIGTNESLNDVIEAWEISDEKSDISDPSNGTHAYEMTIHPKRDKIPIWIHGRLNYIDLNINDIIYSHDTIVQIPDPETGEFIDSITVEEWISHQIVFYDDEYIDTDTIIAHVEEDCADNSSSHKDGTTRYVLYDIGIPSVGINTNPSYNYNGPSYKSFNSTINVKNHLMEQIKKSDDYVRTELVGEDELLNGKDTIYDSVLYSYTNSRNLSDKSWEYNVYYLNKQLLTLIRDQFTESSDSNKILLPNNNWTEKVFHKQALPASFSTGGKCIKMYLLPKNADTKPPIFNGDEYLLYVEYTSLDSNRVRVTTLIQNLSVFDNTVNEKDLKDYHVIDGCITLNDDVYHESYYTNKYKNSNTDKLIPINAKDAYMYNRI